MTNSIITLKIVTVLTTNWVTTSRTIQVVTPQESVYAVYRPSMLNQVGTIYEDKIGKFQWGQEPKEVLLERRVVGRDGRTIAEDNIIGSMFSR